MDKAKFITEIDKKLWDEIIQYCSINNLNETKFIVDTLKMGFTMQKYGLPTQTKIKVEPPKVESDKKNIYKE